MKHRNIPKILLSLFVFVFINSCALPAAIIAQAQQMETFSYYAPEDLNGDAQNTGLLLIDAVRKDGFLLPSWGLSGVTIASLNEPGKEISIGSFNTGGFFGRDSGVVIIPGLTPGLYRIIRASSQYVDLQANVSFQETLKLPIGNIAIEVKANTPVYYGQIQLLKGSTGRKMKLKYEKKREIESWKMVSDKYNDSPWVTIIDEHIKNLE